MWPKTPTPDRAPKETEKNEERFEHPDKGQPELHVYQDGHTGEWTVWLNTGIADHDGLCVGHGTTRDEAVADAVSVLEWGADVLQGTPSPAALVSLGALPPPCWPTKRYLRFMNGAWQEADDVAGPWSEVKHQRRDSGGHTPTS